MKKIFFLFVFCISIQLNATHILGGQIGIKYIGKGGPNQSMFIYELSAILFRDCLNGQADFDDPMILGIYNASNDSLISYQNLYMTSRSNILHTAFCIEQAMYIKQISVSTDFYLTVQRCCMASTYSNIPDDLGFTVFSDVHINSGGGSISNPVYNSPIVVSVGNNDTFDLSSSDFFSDSTVYEFSQPLDGADKNIPQPNPLPKPYAKGPFNVGYSMINPFGSNTINLNRSSGALNINTNTVGKYAIGITVTKYKDSSIIYKQVRDLTIISCSYCSNVGISEHSDLNYGVSVYPNPSGSILHLTMNGITLTDFLDLSIFDPEGKLVIQKQINNLEEIDISKLHVGIYMARVKIDGNVFHSKFSKLE
jgi:hypothetical protein